MAEYLGGINDPDIEVLCLSTDLSDVDFEIEYFDSNSSETDNPHKINIYESITHYEVITSEKVKSSSYSLTWGLAGYLTGGPLWGVVGAILGGDSSTSKKEHVAFCSLNNGWQIALKLTPSELSSWENYIKSALEED